MSDDIPSLLAKLGEMTCRYREYAQLACANKRRAEAAEAQVARLTRAAKIGDSCEMAGLAFIDDDGEVRMSPPREVFEEEIARQSAAAKAAETEVEMLRLERDSFQAAFNLGDLLLKQRAEAAEARVEEMAEALEGLLDAVECVEQSAGRRIIDRHAVEQARSTLCSKAGN